LKGVASTREHWPKISTEHLALISIRLEGMLDLGTPSLLTYHNIYPWLRGHISHVDIDFNLDTDESIDDFLLRQQQLMDLFESGQLKEYLIIFLML
jgi:hypothetical protein